MKQKQLTLKLLNGRINKLLREVRDLRNIRGEKMITQKDFEVEQEININRSQMKSEVEKMIDCREFNPISKKSIS